MRRIGWIGVFLLTLNFIDFSAKAQSSIDVLTQELVEVQHQHEDATSQMFTNFISQLDKAMPSPDDALALYQQAGGDMPDPAAVITQYGNETPSEKEERDAIDQANKTNLAYVLQLHCGLMRYAGFFIIAPDQKGLHEAWIAWLKTAAQIYPQIGGPPDDPRVAPNPAADDDKAGGQKKHKKRAGPPDLAALLKDKPVRDSIISTFLGFTAWGDKDQGQWKVRDIPHLYRTEILDPSRKTPTAATLAAWDAFIAMKSADQPDRDQWNQVDYPGFQFERSCDDYAITPTMEKLSALVDLIKANPTYPGLDGWISRVQQLMQDYRAAKAGGSTAGAAPATNSAPPSPAAPSPAAAPVAAPAPPSSPAPAPATNTTCAPAPPPDSAPIAVMVPITPTTPAPTPAPAPANH